MKKLLCIVAMCVGCSGSEKNSETPVDVGVGPADEMGGRVDLGTADVSTEPPDFSGLGGDRPAAVVLPTDWTPTGNYPVVFMLHGLGANSTKQNVLFRITTLVDELDFVLVLPEGTDSSYGQFWSATDLCCDWDQTGVDDATYLIELADDVLELAAGDPKRLYFMGHSNGGYMSYRMACDYSDRVAAIASLAGSSYVDPSLCGNPEPISVLQIHGTADGTVPFNGGTYEGVPAVIPAQDLVERWAARNGCEEESAFIGVADYDSSASGDETTKEVWRGCDAETEVQLWTMTGSGHVPLIDTDLTRDLLGFLFKRALP